MRRAVCIPPLLLAAAWLGCASAPRVEQGVGETRTFSLADRFAPASTGVLGTENPDFEEPALESLRELIETAIGWRGLTLAPEDGADWLVSCAFRKRIIWKGDISRDPVTEAWTPQTQAQRKPRVLGARTPEYATRGSMGEEVPAVEPWIETIVELRLRSRRTGTIGWSAQRIWGRNRVDLPEDELEATLELLLARVRFQDETAPTKKSEAR